MLNLSDLKQPRVYQDALAEGLEQGRQQEGLTLITRLLERKFGELPLELRSPLAQLTLAQLELSRWTKINVGICRLWLRNETRRPHGLRFANPSYASSKYLRRPTYLLMRCSNSQPWKRS